MAKDCCWNCKHYVITKALDSNVMMLDGPGPNYCRLRMEEEYKGKYINPTYDGYNNYIRTKTENYCDKYEDRFKEWRPSRTKYPYHWLLHGHTHAHPDHRLGDKSLSVAYDSWGRVVNLEEILEIVK